jgi:TRAP-type C4-dicarboxylate transport system permease small subunit|tara:strand:+ start:730 stop:1281 length:552 start_codon:yes stop_codon:yes gene_type:complete
MNNFYKISNKIQSTIEIILGNLSALIMIGVTLFALAEIFRRYILGVVFQWGQDAVIYVMMCSVAFYICVTQIKRGHLVMSAFLQLIGAYGYHRTIGICKILVSFITCIFCGSLTYTAIFTIEYSIRIGERTESLFFFMWPFHLCLAIGLGLSSLVAFLQTIEDVHKYIKGDHFRETVETATDV